MKTVRIHIAKLLFTFSMLLVCLWASAQCIHSDTLSGCPDTLYVGNENTPPSPTIPTTVYSAEEYLHSDGSVLSPDTVDYKSKHIRLNRGFKVGEAGKFSAYIEEHGCETGFNANTYYVNDSSSEGDIYTSNIGSDLTGEGSKENPFASLAYAITKLDFLEGDSIYIDAGTFNDTFIEIADINKLAIIGAGITKTIFDRSYDPENNENEEEGNTGEYPPVGAPFMTISADDILLKGMTIQRYNYFSPGRGNALSVVKGNCIVIDDVNIIDNAGYGEHAALMIYGEDNSVEIRNSSISYNYGFEETAQGGGIDIIGNDNIVGIDNAIIAGNGRDEYGGGIRNFGNNNINFSSSTISQNTSSKGGGAMSSVGKTSISITATCVLGNVSTGTPIINHGNTGGGIISASGGGLRFGQNTEKVIIHNALFEDNRAGTDGAHGMGGAIFVGDAPLDVDSSMHILDINFVEFINNIADDGADIFIDNFQTTIDHSSFTTPEVIHIFNASNAAIGISNSGTPNRFGDVDFINNNIFQASVDRECDVIDIFCNKPAGLSVRYFCATQNATLSDIGLLGCFPNIIYWYSQNSGGGVLNPNTQLTDGTTYYASCYASGFCSTYRFAVTVYLIDMSDCGGRSSCEEEYTICPGESIELFSDYNDGIYNYEWNTIENLEISNQVIASPAETTVYTVTVSSDYCVEESYDLKFTINVATNNDITFPTNISTCVDNYNNPQLIAGGGESYLWSPATGLSCNTCPNPTVNVTAPTTYDIIITDANGCEHTGSVYVDVTSGPMVTVQVLNDVVCLGEQVELMASGAESYQWSPANLVICNDAQCASPYFIANENNVTTYTVIGFIDGCFSEAEVEVLLAPEYNVDIEIAIDGCTATFMPQPFMQNLSYEWSVTNHGIIPHEGGTAMHEFPNNGPYNVCLTMIGEECGQEVEKCESFNIETCTCIDDECFTFSVNPDVIYYVNGGCFMPAIGLPSNASGGTMPYTYQWTGPNNFSSTLEFPGIGNPTTANNGTYTIVVTDANSCTATGTVEVTDVVDGQVQPEITVSEVGCEGGEVVLSVTNYNDNIDVTYTWTTPNGTTQNISGFNTNELTINPVDAALHEGSYSVTVEINGCILESDAYNLMLTPVPAIIYVGGSSTYCAGDDVIISVVLNGTPNNTTYTWSGPNNFSASGNITGTTIPLQIPNADVSDAGVYTLIMTNEDGCSSVPFPATITIDDCGDCTESQLEASPTADVNADCPFSNVSLVANASGGTAPYTYQWTGPNGFTASFANPGIANANSNNNGTYTVVVTDANGCSSASSVIVEIDDCGDECSTFSTNPSIEYQQFCDPVEFTITAGTIGGTPPYTYQWTYPSEFTSNDENINITNASQVNNGIYSVIVTDANGCVTTGSVEYEAFYIKCGTGIGSTSCPYVNLAYGVSVEGGTGPYTFNWTGPNDFTSSEQSDMADILTTGVGGTLTVTVKVTDANGCSLEDACTVINFCDSSFDCPDQMANIGDPCDDENLVTTCDIVLEDCSCVGTLGFINEFAYDCGGDDMGEFIEVAIHVDAVISNVHIYLYNGNGGGTYDSPISITSGNYSYSNGNYDYYTIFMGDLEPPINLQNADIPWPPRPDGIALTYNDNLICDSFISYEGQLTATSGPAKDMTSNDVGVSQGDSGICMVESIQLLPDGQWVLACATPGMINQDVKIGDACNDEDPATIDDVIQADCSCSGVLATCPDAYINEFSYECIDDDEGHEFIEVAIPNTYQGDLANFEIYLYNGNGSGTYGSSPDLLTFTEGSNDGTYTYYFSYISEIQNGNPDGMALVYNSTVVCEFISYEGTITASNGPAMDMMSEDVGVEQSDTETSCDPLGSIQRNDDGTWGLACNSNPGSPNVPIYPGDACDDGDSNTDNDVIQNDCSCLGVFYDCPNQINIGDPCNDGDSATTNDVVQNDCSCMGSIPTCPDAYISEFTYECRGSDYGNEFIEVAIPNAYVDDDLLPDFKIYLYNGNGGAYYNSVKAVSNFMMGDNDGTHTYFYLFYLTSPYIQNGNPDGIALVYNEIVCEFISYDGIFSATNGPAMDIVSEDVGATQSNTHTYCGESIQLIDRDNNTWINACQTYGEVNDTQLCVCISTIVTSMPAGGQVCEGDNVQFFTQVTNDGTPGLSYNYAWYFNGSPWMISGSPVIQQNPLITAADISDNGTYQVQVTAELNGNTYCISELSDPITVTVESVPGAPNATNSGPGTVGGSVDLIVINPIPGATYTWYSATSTVVGTGATLTLTNLSSNDQGSYYVSAELNGCTSDLGGTKLIVN